MTLVAMMWYALMFWFCVAVYVAVDVDYVVVIIVVGCVVRYFGVIVYYGYYGCWCRVCRRCGCLWC